MQQLVHGPAINAHDLLLRAAQVYTASHPSDSGGVAVEVVTQEPYNVTVGVVTAVGYKFGDVLLTVEPTEERPTKAELIDRLAQLLREVDGNHDLDAGALAEALVERGVLPMRGY